MREISADELFEREEVGKIIEDLKVNLGRLERNGMKKAKRTLKKLIEKYNLPKLVLGYEAVYQPPFGFTLKNSLIPTEDVLVDILIEKEAERLREKYKEELIQIIPPMLSLYKTKNGWDVHGATNHIAEIIARKEYGIEIPEEEEKWVEFLNGDGGALYLASWRAVNKMFSPLFAGRLPAEIEDEEKYSEKEKGKKRKFGAPLLIGTLLAGAAGLSIYLDASYNAIDLPLINKKLPGLINAIKAEKIQSSTGADWNKAVDLALHTDNFDFISELFGKKTDFSKTIEIYKQLDGNRDPNVLSLLDLFLEDKKLSVDEIKCVEIYKQLDGNKDPNVLSLLKFFLKDKKLSADEINSVSYYARVRDDLIPKDLFPFWPLEERGKLAYQFCAQLLSDGKITEEEKKVAEIMLNFERPMVAVRGIEKGIILDPYKDHDNDGFPTITELLRGSNPLNPLETPNTNRSELYVITINGAVCGYYNSSLQTILSFQYLLLKYGIPKDHIVTFANQRCDIEHLKDIDPLATTDFFRKEFLPEIKGHLLKNYPLRIDYLDENCTRSNFIREVKRIFPLADSNDVIFIFYEGHGGGFVLPVTNDVIGPYDTAQIFKSVPREGKLILYYEGCGAEGYVKSLKEEMIKQNVSLRGFVGIASVSSDEDSIGFFSYLFLSKLRDGYSIKDAIPTEYTYSKAKIRHPVVYLGEDNYEWLKYYNPFNG
jgi:hypothetical protein